VELKVSDHRTVHALPCASWAAARAGSRRAARASHGREDRVDTRPPAGVGLETTVVRRHLVCSCCIMTARRCSPGSSTAAVVSLPQGADLFDLLWYLSDRKWPLPNLVLLNNALAQTGWPGAALTPRSWRAASAAHCGTRLGQRVADVSPFLEPSRARPADPRQSAAPAAAAEIGGALTTRLWTGSG